MDDKKHTFCDYGLQWLINVSVRIFMKCTHVCALILNRTRFPLFSTQELDVDFFLYLYTLYAVKGRTVTPMLHKLFLGELHRYYSGYNLVRIPVVSLCACIVANV